MPILHSSIVAKGQRFSPPAVASPAFLSIFDQEPLNSIATPMVALVDFPGGLHIVIQEDRVDVKKDLPASEFDGQMSHLMRSILALFPFITPSAIGVNFIMGEPYSELGDTPVLPKLLNVALTERVFEHEPEGAVVSLTFPAHGAAVTAKITTDALLNERPGLTLDINAHHTPVEDIDRILASVHDWRLRCIGWFDGVANAR